MAAKVDISFIVTVYNTAPWLARCIESCLAQASENIKFEIVIINDGSTDQSESIINSYADQYSQIRTVFQINSGPAAARNAGLKIAKGTFIWFVDSDDYLLPNKTDKLLHLAKQSKAEIVSFRSISNNPILGPTPQWRYPIGLSSTKEILTFSCYQVSLCIHLFNRTWLLKNNLYVPDLDRFEDNLFMLNCLLTEGSLFAINDICYNVNPRVNSISRSDQADIAFSMFPSLEAIGQVLDKNQNDKPVAKVIANHMAGDIGLLLFKARKSQETFTACCKRINSNPLLCQVLKSATSLQHRAILKLISYPRLLRSAILLWHRKRMD